MKIVEAEEAGLSFEEVIAKAEQFREEEHTYFVLESLETLRKNGRLSNLKHWRQMYLILSLLWGLIPTAILSSWIRQEA